MRIAITGATGFLGRYIVAQLAAAGHRLTCWHRPTSDLGHFPASIPAGAVRWVEGALGDEKAARRLVEEADAVVHAALDHPGGGFRGAEGDLLAFAEANVMGTLRLVEAARNAGVARFIFISTCAVHDRILPDRPLDETHPLWMSNHYGAHKAAIEAFVHSFGFGQGWPICACGRRESTGSLTPLATASGIRWSATWPRASRSNAGVVARKSMRGTWRGRSRSCSPPTRPGSPAKPSIVTTVMSRISRWRRSPGSSRAPWPRSGASQPRAAEPDRDRQARCARDDLRRNRLAQRDGRAAYRCLTGERPGGAHRE